MALKGLMLSDKKPRSQKVTYWAIPFTQQFWNDILEMENRWVFARGWWQGGEAGRGQVWLQRGSMREILVMMEHKSTHDKTA